MTSHPLLKLCCLGLCSLFLLSCRPGFDLANLQAPPARSEQLPRLQLELDQTSFQNLYPGPFVQQEFVDDDGNVSYAVQPRAQVPYQDVMTITSRTLNQSWCVSRGDYYGTARLKVTSHSVMGRSMGLTLLSASTLFIPNVLGMPLNRVEAVMEFEMEFLDARGQLMKNYIGQGRASQANGLYYGGGDAHRTVHAKAVNRALQEIQEQWTRDVKLLKSVMQEIGPMPAEKLTGGG
jgi:hypothetical protein